MTYDLALLELLKTSARIAGKTNGDLSALGEVNALCGHQLHALLAKLGYVRQPVAAEPAQPALEAVEPVSEPEHDEAAG